MCNHKPDTRVWASHNCDQIYFAEQGLSTAKIPAVPGTKIRSVDNTQQSADIDFLLFCDVELAVFGSLFVFFFLFLFHSDLNLKTTDPEIYIFAAASAIVAKPVNLAVRIQCIYSSTLSPGLDITQQCETGTIANGFTPDHREWRARAWRLDAEL